MKRAWKSGWLLGIAGALVFWASGCSQEEVETNNVRSDSGAGEEGRPDAKEQEDPSGGSGGASDEGGSGGTGGEQATGGSGDTGGTAGSGGSGGTGGTGGGVEEQPSCKGLAEACGDKGNNSCCSSILVPGGSYPMGRSESGTDACPAEMLCDEKEQPEHDVTVSEFLLDEYEVTVGRFRKFVAAYTKPKAGDGAHPKIPNSGWKSEWDSKLPSTADELKSKLKCENTYQTWRDTAGETEQHPINCVSWYESFAFCAWDGGRLPTEAEWEKAAAGGNENRLFPWGAAVPDGTRAVFDCLYDGNSGCTFADIAKVGSFPAGAGRWGHKDLASNMWEWVLDWYAENWYGGQGNACIDCANLEEATIRVLRGGCFRNIAAVLRATDRHNYAPATRTRYYGFRCARPR